MNRCRPSLLFRLTVVLLLAALFSLLAYLSLPRLATNVRAACGPWSDPTPPSSGPDVFTITGVVSDYANNPVECVQVFAFSGAAQFSAHTDVNGQFTLVLEAGVYNLIFNPVPGNGLASVAMRGIKESQDMEVSLPAGKTVTINVFSDTAKLHPVDKVAFFAFNPDTFSGFGLSPPSVSGTYQISLENGTWELTLTPPHLIGLGPTQVIITVTQNMTQDVVLGPGFTLSGYVRDRDDSGLANVEIFAQDFSQPHGFGFSPSNASGFYRGTLPAGTFDVSFMPPPFDEDGAPSRLGSTVITDVTGPPDVDLPPLKLPAGHTVSGTVTCRYGQPNFFVQAVPKEGVSAGLFSGWGTYTDGDGFFALALQPGSYDLEVSAPLGSELRPLEPRRVEVNQNLTENFEYPCVEGTIYARVLDETGEPLTDATVYHNGKAIIDALNGSPTTDINGNLVLENLAMGDTLVAMALLHDQPTARDGHGGWGYRVYKTNLPLNNNGEPLPFTAVMTGTGPQTLTVRADNPLVLFNLLVSIEWDATEEYIQQIVTATQKASSYLYDVTDGQMSFGRVVIYDEGQYWADADIQISTKNTVRPYAFVGGINSPDKAHTIRLGRFWNGGSGSSGAWSEPAGYRTLIHEFGHYALNLYDSYFLRLTGPDGFSHQVDAFCTSKDVLTNSSDATNASIMYYQYNASELADKNHNWDEKCKDTEQYHQNQGRSDWETVAEFYHGPGWTVKTPSARSAMMAGPDEFPDQLLPFPDIEDNNSGQAGGPFLQLTVRDPENRPKSNALVALYINTLQGKIAIDQGLTDQQGQIAVYGATAGDQIRSATFDGALAGSVEVTGQKDYDLRLSPTNFVGLSALANLPTPYLNLTPSTGGDEMTLQVHGASTGGILIGIVFPSEGGGAAQSTPLTYNPGEESYEGSVSFSGVGLGSGTVRVVGVSGDQVIALNSNYNLQQVKAITTNHLYSEDGNFEMHIPPNGVLADSYSTVLPTGYVPGPLPAGKDVIGTAYQVRLSGVQLSTTKESLVRLHYHPEVTGVYTDTAIYFWNPVSDTWQYRGGEPNEIDNAWTVTTTRLGIYALMGQPAPSGEPTGRNSIFLPLIVK